MLLNIKQVGEQVLRQPARTVERDEILSEEFQQLIESMRETMRAAPGVGLAAPQVGLPLQLAVIEDSEDYQKELTPAQLADHERRPVAFHVLINPKIVATDEAQVEFFEGCLSFAGFAAIVPRARSVTVEYFDEKAEVVRIDASGWYARILQHEIDHLHGNLYLDRMHGRTLMSVENLKRYWKDCSVAEVRSKLG